MHTKGLKAGGPTGQDMRKHGREHGSGHEPKGPIMVAHRRRTALPSIAGRTGTTFPAESYAKPHTMAGKKVDYGDHDGTNPGFGKNKSKLDELDVSVGHLSKSAGEEPIKTEGITMRGHGAAVKGIKSRGPMA
jgi:hypothetical protein